MKSADQIPYYAPDGSSMGFRTLEAAKRLIAGGYVKPAYGRKGHLKAIWLLQKDGGTPVDDTPPSGPRYRRRGASSAQRGEGYQESLRPFVQDRAIAVRTSPQVLGGGI